MLNRDVAEWYTNGYQAHANGCNSDSCPYGYCELKAYCAWMGGWHDYNNGGE